MTHPPPEHRADIQGLRGIAILAVLGVHAWPDVLRGGFVGVDVFFVLSGFLISTLLWREQAQTGRIALGRFYARRALRLFPALALVLAACLVFSALFTFPSDAQRTGRHVAAGAAFAANLALWQEAGYFDATSETKPLLHLWSLGIEEQFYLLWPLVLLAAARLRWRQGHVVVALLLLSFALNAAFVADKAKGTFFLLPTRAWELLVGALVARAALHEGARAWAHAHRNALSAAGALLLTAAFALLDKSRTFPGWWALLPTLGTAALLAAGAQGWVNRQVLCHPVLVFYGGISYALYLWHWPLLVYPVLLGVEVDAAVRVAMLAGAVALAHLTTEYLERPLRFGRQRPGLPLRLAGTLAAVGGAGAVLAVTDGGVSAYPVGVQAVARAESGFDFGVYRSARCFLDLAQGPDAFAPECRAAGAPGARELLLWGDSHAASLYPGLSAQHGGPLLSQWTKARCPPLLQPRPGASAGCSDATAHVWNAVQRQPPDTVVMAAQWSMYGDDDATAAALVATVQGLHAAGVARVVVVGHLPMWTEPLPRLLLREWSRSRALPERSAEHLDARALQADRRLRAALAGSAVVYVSPLDHLCNATGCRTTQVVDGIVQPLAFDESHLTAAGSRLLVAAVAPDLLR